MAFSRNRTWLVRALGLTVACGLATGVIAAPSSSRPAPADLVFVGGKVATMTHDASEVTAVAVRDGDIVAVGSDADVTALIGTATRVVPLEGRLLVPGLVEGHGHLVSLGKKRMTLDLADLTSKQDALRLVAAAASGQAKGTWIVGRGWDQNLWPERAFPTAQELSRVSPDHPVFLTRVDGHAAWVNERALRMAGVTARTPDPTGGRLIRDQEGRPTGILIDNAMDLVRRILPSMTRADVKRAAQIALAESVSHGITAFHDAGTDQATIDVYRELLSEGALPLRLYVMLDGGDGALLSRYFRGGPVRLGDDRLIIRAVKLMADGALGSRGAALLDDYADEPGHKGLLILSASQIRDVARRALAAGFQVATHAIGDQANRSVLDGYEQALRTVPRGTDHRFRIEHAQIVHPDDVPRFVALGVIPSMQAIHCTSDMPWVPERLGDERTAERAYVWRSFLRAGARIVNGSDTPIEPVNPFWGIYAAFTRQDRHGEPSSGWNPAERMSRLEALRSFTIDAAFASFLEGRTGTIEVGKAADLAVLSTDILSAPPSEVLDTTAVMTVVAGNIVYESK